MTNAGSYLSSNDARLLVGLGTATGVKSVEIIWPGGQTQSYTIPAIDKYHTLVERKAK